MKDMYLLTFIAIGEVYLYLVPKDVYDSITDNDSALKAVQGKTPPDYDTPYYMAFDVKSLLDYVIKNNINVIEESEYVKY